MKKFKVLLIQTTGMYGNYTTILHEPDSEKKMLFDTEQLAIEYCNKHNWILEFAILPVFVKNDNTNLTS